MSTKKKLLEAAAGAAGGEALYVEDVFSTYLYDGTGSAQTITNGIDLDGEGGMVWGKVRDIVDGHWLVDSERGTGTNNNFKYLRSDTTTAEIDLASRSLSSFNSDGFTFQAGDSQFNASGNEYCSWTFRKAPNFFDVVTYTGNGSAPRTINHNLGSVPGMIIIKRTDATANWAVYHRGSPVGAGGKTYNLGLNRDNPAGNSDFWPSTPTSTDFVVGDTDSAVNASGGTYVAYLFAHNDGDGEFGESGDQDIIKCGGYTGAGTVDLGFEPQWVLYKRTDSTRPWYLNDTMRGFPVDGNQAFLYANTSDAESSGGGLINPTSTGFTHINAGTYIYIAIRRGPMKTPESGTEVFAMDTAGGTSPTPPTYVSGFPVDMVIQRLNKNTNSDPRVNSRLTGTAFLKTSTTDAESGDSGYTFDYMNGFRADTGTDANDFTWMFRRAPGFFDVVAYNGNSTAGRTVSHNLGVVPELIIVKKRNNARDWKVYHSATGNGKASELNAADVPYDSPAFWNDTTPTDSVFSVGSSETVNGSGDTYIAYLFATLDGISKVGSYTGNGTSQTIDCGFSTGARFVLIKRTDGSGNWKVMDTARGIVAGDDKVLELDNTSAESTFDLIDPDSSGFAVEGNTTQGQNQSGATYIFLAIA